MSSTLSPDTTVAGLGPATSAPVVAGEAARPARERLLSLDVFRGMTVAGMLLVNNPGTWSAIYDPLEHAPWHGWTPTDLVFPFFLFIVGITTHLSLSVRRARGDDDAALVKQVLRRGALIFLFGLFLSWYPGVQWGHPRDLADPGVVGRAIYRLEHLRIMGVLQRIGLAYILAGLATVFLSLRAQVIAAVTVLFGYWLAMTIVPVPDHGLMGLHVLHQPGATLDAWIDRAVFGKAHLWSGAGGLRDPEGLLSTLPAAATALLGVFAGRWIGMPRPIHERLAGLFAAGALAMAAGSAWHWVFPINKSLWTSSYVLFTGGMAAVTLATCMWIIDVHRRDRWTKPFVIYGVNPMLAFVGSGIMARLIYTVSPAQRKIYEALYASWLSPVNASLAFAVSFVLLWLAILTFFHRRGIILKV